MNSDSVSNLAFYRLFYFKWTNESIKQLCNAALVRVAEQNEHKKLCQTSYSFLFGVVRSAGWSLLSSTVHLSSANLNVRQAQKDHKSGKEENGYISICFKYISMCFNVFQYVLIWSLHNRQEESPMMPSHDPWDLAWYQLLSHRRAGKATQNNSYHNSHSNAEKVMLGKCRAKCSWKSCATILEKIYCNGVFYVGPHSSIPISILRVLSGPWVHNTSWPQWCFDMGSAGAASGSATGSWGVLPDLPDLPTPSSPHFCLTLPPHSCNRSSQWSGHKLRVQRIAEGKSFQLGTITEF